MASQQRGPTLEQGGATFSNLLPPVRDEVADSEREAWNVNELYMKELY